MDFSPKKIVFVLLFTALVLIGSQINFSTLIGAEESQFFTLFQFFGPISGAFLGPLVGAFSVLTAQAISFFVVGKEISLINVARLLPMLFAAYYFGTSKKKEWGLIVPLLAIGAFVLHPIGQQVWYYAVMFWTIPLLMRLVFPNKLFAKSLGATFTAHAVGGAIWIYTIPMTVEAWNLLIPIVIFERTIFAVGISVSYIAMNTVLARVVHFLPSGVIVDSKYDALKMLSFK